MKVKKIISFSITLSSLLLYGCNGLNNSTSLTANVKEAGTLSQQYSYQDWENVKELKIIGNIDNNDISFIKALDNKGLERLDLSEVENMRQIGFFFGHNKFKSIVLPKNVEGIANESFQGCTNIEAIEVDSCNKYFKLKDSILYSADFKRIILYPSKLKAKSFSIPESVNEIANGALAAVQSLENISVENGNKAFASIDGVLYNNDTTQLLAYPAGKKDSIFTLPKTILKINRTSFWGCKNLKYFQVEKGNAKFRSIDGLLAERNNLTNNDSYSYSLRFFPAGMVCDSYQLPDSINAISPFAFHSCKIKQLTLNANVTSIDKWAFGSAEINNIDISKDNATFSYGNGIIYKGSVAYLGLPTYNGEVNVKKTASIDERAFQRCKFKRISIAPTIVSGPFMCSNSEIEEAVIEEGNTDLQGFGTFFCCPKLKSVDLPSSLEHINNRMFFGCIGLTSVTCRAEKAPKIDDFAFSGVDMDHCTLYVPEKSIEIYKSNAQWKQFKNIKAIQ